MDCGSNGFPRRWLRKFYQPWNEFARIGRIEILKTLRLFLIVEYDAYERSIDVKSAVVLDESEFSEFVIKKLTRERVLPIHLRQGFPDAFGGISLRVDRLR